MADREEGECMYVFIYVCVYTSVFMCVSVHWYVSLKTALFSFGLVH